MIETAKVAALAAGEIILKYFDKGVVIENKEDKTSVTIADTEAEEAIRKIILNKYPEHSINGEEEGKTGKGTIVWHVDPLDGTKNFVENIPYSAVSIGIEKNDEFIIGVIYNPYSKELFYAEKGKGAFVNDKKIRVSKHETGQFVVDSSFRGDRTWRKLAACKDMISHTANIRMIGSTALALTEIARGWCIYLLSDAIHAYDFAAGVVILQEAGGIVTDQFGNDPNPRCTVQIAANNNKNHGLLLEIAKKYYSDYKGM